MRNFVRIAKAVTEAALLVRDLLLILLIIRPLQLLYFGFYWLVTGKWPDE